MDQVMLRRNLSEISPGPFIHRKAPVFVCSCRKAPARRKRSVEGTVVNPTLARAPSVLRGG